MYPIKFKSLYYEKIWGGRGLQSFRDDLPDGNIGESWDVACRSNGMSIVSNGEFKDMKFDELIKKMGDKIVGTKIDRHRFPLLIKLINATQKLSIQVHPDDEYANKVENEMGKTEVWYVIEALPGASLIVGTKNECSIDEFKKGIKTGTLEKFLNKIPVKKGDVYFIKSGMVHAICEGLVLAEIQQNSDVTYRVYDYNRGRELHVKKALDVINFNLKPKKSTGLKIQRDGYAKTYLCFSREFSLELYDISKEALEHSDRERFYIFTCVDGCGDIIYDGGAEPIKKGDSVLIPASLGKYSLKGKMKLLRSYVPNFDKLEKSILSEVEKI
ncbi:mannose-6-phosphate isomerase [Clostridium algifaecis]|uniref:Phosphohexomutase n=1 Tax=Clostridium algifaecis TaxID=1472040 RepID=A0ABS4KW39_9CLOT|nr:type I phosphomannose isomerase catalytic subunit [Clostridium algifaecis]MBP2033860.1 mannose-6-phosphate isomerase [Clostridium algifaecis]